jgi:hypothetical protein
VYLLSLAYANASLNGSGQFPLIHGNRALNKWTLLEANERHRELLRLVVISCSSPVFLAQLTFSLRELHDAEKGPLRVGHVRVLHDAVDTIQGRGMAVTGGAKVNGRGEVSPLSKSKGEAFFQDFAFRTPSPKATLRRDFLLAYGDDFLAHDGDDDFDFLDPLFRSRRFISLFSASAPLNDPVAFLERLFYRGARKKRRVPFQVLQRICALLFRYFGLELRHWLENPGTAVEEWGSLPSELHKPLIPILDAVRHVLDALPNRSGPLVSPGLILLDRPDRYCRDEALTAWLAFFDDLFPNMQFLARIPSTKRHLVPDELLQRELPIPPLQTHAPKSTVRQLSGRLAHRC